jgi:hypothetical protein
MFGCPDCANAEKETKTHATSNKGRRNLVKILSPFEENSDCTDTASRSKFWTSSEIVREIVTLVRLDKARRRHRVGEVWKNLPELLFMEMTSVMRASHSLTVTLRKAGQVELLRRRLINLARARSCTPALDGVKIVFGGRFTARRPGYCAVLATCQRSGRTTLWIVREDRQKCCWCFHGFLFKKLFPGQQLRARVSYRVLSGEVYGRLSRFPTKRWFSLHNGIAGAVEVCVADSIAEYGRRHALNAAEVARLIMTFHCPVESKTSRIHRGEVLGNHR